MHTKALETKQRITLQLTTKWRTENRKWLTESIE